MVFKPVVLSDKELFYRYSYYEDGSDSTFTTPFIWSEGYHIKFAFADDLLYTKGSFGNTDYFLMPKGKNPAFGISRLLSEYGRLTFRGLTENDANFLNSSFRGMFEIKDDRDTAEYIYLTESLITLSGKKLHAKKNHLNKFLATYDYEYKEISKDNINEAQAFVLSDCHSKAESIAMLRLFENWGKLDVCGAVIVIDGKIKAATAGERLNKNTALIHLEKADKEINGVYAAINNLFAKNTFANTLYINREEDMGIEGLRKAKLSYQPISFYKRYTAQYL